jgi:hypothetical protein
VHLCQHIEQELEMALLKKIVELLQEATNSAALSTTANTQGRNASYDLSALNSDLEKNISGNWRKVYYNRQKYNKQPDKQQQPVLTIVNRFSLPGNLQEESEAFQFPGLVEKTAPVKNKNK